MKSGTTEFIPLNIIEGKNRFLSLYGNPRFLEYLSFGSPLKSFTNFDTATGNSPKIPGRWFSPANKQYLIVFEDDRSNGNTRLIRIFLSLHRQGRFQNDDAPIMHSLETIAIPSFPVKNGPGITDIELRVFTPIGMLECWNSGLMGSGIMQCWINGKIRIHDKIKKANILLKTNIPSFHHSIIPFPGKIQKPIK